MLSLLHQHEYSMSASTTDEMRALEGRQPKLIAAILLPENAKKEAVHAEKDAAPKEDSNLLSTRIGDAGYLEGERDSSKREHAVWMLLAIRSAQGYLLLTDSSHNLRLQSKLVAEATRKVVDATLSVARDIGDLANMVEHVATGEKQHGDEAERGPKVAVLQNGNHIGRCDSHKGDDTKNGGGHRDNLDPIDGAGYGGLRCIGRELARKPGVDLLCRLRTVRLSDVYIYLHQYTVYAHPLVKSKRTGCVSTFALGPTVGWK